MNKDNFIFSRKQHSLTLDAVFWEGPLPRETVSGVREITKRMRILSISDLLFYPSQQQISPKTSSRRPYSNLTSKQSSCPKWKQGQRSTSGPESYLSRWTITWIMSFWRLSMYEKSPSRIAEGSISFCCLRWHIDSFAITTPGKS